MILVISFCYKTRLPSPACIPYKMVCVEIFCCCFACFLLPLIFLSCCLLGFFVVVVLLFMVFYNSCVLLAFLLLLSESGVDIYVKEHFYLLRCVFFSCSSISFLFCFLHFYNNKMDLTIKRKEKKALC